MASLEELTQAVQENTRAIRGGNGDGGMVSEINVMKSEFTSFRGDISRRLDSIQTLLSDSNFATEQDLKNLKKDLRAERLEDLENLKGRIQDVKEGAIDWKWLVTALLAIISPIAVGIFMTFFH